MSQRTIEGTILVGDGLDPVEGRIVLEAGVIVAIEEAAVASSAIICPAFVNAHTHVGDSVAKDAGTGLSLPELVAPPDGLKHRLLANADDATLVAAMGRSLRLMEQAGIGACYDFREGGTDGVALFRRAAANHRLDAIAFGRGPPEVLDVADGYGASGAADAEFEPVRRAARRANKPFAIHAGEVDGSDINAALDLQPDLLIHMVHPADLHLERLADAGTPVVCCPRANATTGVGLPPISTLAECTTVALGTDNVMVASPTMFREMAFASVVCGVPPRAALKMATVNAARILGRPDGVLEVGRPARLVVLDGESDNLAGTVDPITAIVRRADRADVLEVNLPPIGPDS